MAEHHSGCWANYGACAVCSEQPAAPAPRRAPPAAPESAPQEAPPAAPESAPQEAPPAAPESAEPAPEGESSEDEKKARRGLIFAVAGFALSVLIALSGLGVDPEDWVTALLCLVLAQPFVIAAVLLCVLGVRGAKSKLAGVGLLLCALYELYLVWVVLHQG